MYVISIQSFLNHNNTIHIIISLNVQEYYNNNHCQIIFALSTDEIHEGDQKNGNNNTKGNEIINQGKYRVIG